MTGLGYNPSSRWSSVRWVARVVWSRVAESRPCCWRPRTAAAGGRPQAGLEHEEKVLTDSINTANKTASARVKYGQLPPADLEAERWTRLTSRWSADHSQLTWSLLVSGAVLYSARAACTAAIRSASSAGVTAIVESDSCECSEPL
jgi:hypothetical protein